MNFGVLAADKGGKKGKTVAYNMTAEEKGIFEKLVQEVRVWLKSKRGE